MCCYNKESSWKQFKLDHPNRDTFIPVYKRLNVVGGIGAKRLDSPQQSKQWKPGLHVDVESPRKRAGAVKGIHVYLKNNAATMSYAGKDRKTVKLYALVSSVIAVNENHAVFGTVLLTQKEYDKATR